MLVISVDKIPIGQGFRPQIKTGQIEIIPICPVKSV